MSLAVQETDNEKSGECKKCAECGIDIDVDNLSFEQRLIVDRDFFRKCWDSVMDETEDVRLPSLTLARN